MTNHVTMTSIVIAVNTSNLLSHYVFFSCLSVRKFQLRK